MATNPTLITTPFAQSGDKTTPPNTNTPSDGRFSQTLGFPPVTAIPPRSGGKAPKREDFNGAFNMLSNIVFYAQKGWIFQWDNSQSYYAGCIVRYNGNLYECTSDVTSTTAPSSDTSHWSKYNITPGTTYAPINSPAFTGTPTSPTPTTSDNSTKIATTAYVKNNLSTYAPINSPAFTGTPTSTTPSSGDDSTKIATTAFVQAAVSGGGGDPVVNTYVNTSTGDWYRQYKSGWLEQGGQTGSGTGTGISPITFLKPYANTAYAISLVKMRPTHTGAGGVDFPPGVNGNRATTGFTITQQGSSGGTSFDYYSLWATFGQGVAP